MGRLLSRDDLTFQSPYNTYTSDGLPPKPICNPGRASLMAATHPETHEYIYFVADGTGGHVFSKTLSEHNQKVSRWQSIQKAPIVQPVKKPAQKPAVPDATKKEGAVKKEEPTKKAEPAAPKKEKPAVKKEPKATKEKLEPTP
jgi:hypothetical protein